MRTISSSAKLRKRTTVFQHYFVVFLFLGIFAGVIGFLAFQNFRIYQKRTELSNIAKDLRAQIAALQERKQALEAGIVEVESVEYQEKVLREQGLYQKPGEEVFTILPSEESDATNTQEQKRAWWNPFTW